jgi:hypothetical protein
VTYVHCVRLGELGAPPCCSSCHEDLENDYYDLMELDLEDDLTVVFCCAKRDWVVENGDLIRKEQRDGEASLPDS